MVEHILFLAVLFLALFFTFTNGFQDGSSVCAAPIASRAMTPFQAICFVASCELAGALFGGSAVSKAMESITDWPARSDLLPVLISALIAAISWNFITRWAKVPSSSTHALVGGLIGALFGAGGSTHMNWGHAQSLWQADGVAKVVLSLFLSPILGFAAGFIVLVSLVVLLIKASLKVNKQLKWLQWVSTGLLAFGHGANDPQKSMGVIMLALHATAAPGITEIPLSVRFGTGLAMAIGIVALAPGIVQKVGVRIYKLRNLHALSSETASAIVVLGGSLTGGPVSASQVISSTVIGVGSAVRPKRLHWMIVQEMLLAWCLTIPCSALLAVVLYLGVFQWLQRLL